MSSLLSDSFGRSLTCVVKVDQVLSLAKPDAQQRIDYKEFMKVLLPQPLPKYPREVDLKQ